MPKPRKKKPLTRSLLRLLMVKQLMVDGGIKDMEHYRECMGEIRACDYTLVELSEMLKKQEELNA